jgi:hypothetical protein
VLSENKKFQDETDFWIWMGFDHAWDKHSSLLRAFVNYGRKKVFEHWPRDEQV